MAMGYYSMGSGGYEIDVDKSGEYVYWVWVYVGSQREQIRHKAKIYWTNSGRAYFRADGRRIHLDEVIENR